MSKNNLRKNIEILDEIVSEYEREILEKFEEKISPLNGIVQLWSSLTKDQFIELFKTCMKNSNLVNMCSILEEIYNWKIIDNQYRPEFGLDLRNTMDLAIKNLLKFLEKEEILDICTGFFSPSVWELIGDEFEKIHGTRLLIGNEYEIPKDSTERIQDVFQDMLRIKKEKNEKEELTHLEKSSIIHKSLIEDTSIDDFNLTQCILDLLSFLERDTVDVKLQKYPFQHGKLYLSNELAYLGSSNFTKSGLISNRELNIQIQDKKLLTKLKNWYDQQFENGTQYKDELIQLIQRSKFGNYPYTPFEVYMKIAFEQYKNDFLKIIEEGQIQLAQFQAEGASKALGAIKKFGGVMIADAVGLGKSFTAMAILENLKLHRGLIICPAQLRNKWEKFMEDFPACRVYSMEKMSLDLPRKQDETPMDYDVILIDESHNFRTRGTKRYNNLLTLLEHSTNPKVILLTATPINISLIDLLNQIILISGKGKGFSSIGIPDLQEYFKKIERGEADIDLIKQYLMVVHCRAMIRNRQKVHGVDIMLPNGVLIEFPDRTLNTVKYSIIPMTEEQLNEYNEELNNWREKIAELMNGYENGSVPEERKRKILDLRPKSPSEIYYEEVFDILNDLNLVPFNLEKYKKSEDQDITVLNRNLGLTGMLRTTLLKRMESSMFSFIDSLEKHLKLYYIFEYLIEKDFVATSLFIRKLEEEYLNNETEDDNELQERDFDNEVENLVNFVEQLSPQELEKMRIKKLSEEEIEKRKDQDIYYKFLKRIEPEKYIKNYKEKMMEDVVRDKENLEILLEKTKEIFDKGDFKLSQLKSTLTDMLSKAQNEEERKIIVFSYFRTTADYIFEELINDDELNKQNNFPKISKITGKTPSDIRIDLVERFAPHSCVLELQGASKIKKEEELRKKEKINILISTDVLSEGQNLQDGRYVINYDLHWNPVRMIQRSGRIDRLGALHKKVGIYNFFPQTGLEQLIQLIERIRRRLSTIDEAIGLDADILQTGDARKKRLIEEEQKKRQEENKRREEIIRIENEEVAILNEFEERMEIGGSDISKIRLFGEIKKQGYDYYENIVPLGIHSGLVNMQFSGIIVVVCIVKEGVEQLKWIYWSEDEEYRNKLKYSNGLLVEKPTIERMLDNLVSEWDEIKRGRFPDDERYLAEEPQALFEKVIQIIQSFKNYMTKKEKILRLKEKRPLKGNGVYYNFISRAIQLRLITENFAKRFINLLFERSIEVLAKEEKVKQIVDEFRDVQKEIERITNDLEIDKLEKEEIINGLYEKGAKDLISSFYKYMDVIGIETRRKEKSKIEDKNLKLVGFIRLYKLEALEKYNEI